MRLLSDYAAHPQGALTWRFERDAVGAGVLGDLASHGVDLARYLLGDIEALMADTGIFVPERARRPSGTTGHYGLAGGQLRKVENEDYVACLMRLADGTRVTLEASRVTWGSSTTTASRSTARKASCTGTSAGWANSVSAPATITRTRRSARCSSGRDTVASRRFSHAGLQLGFDDLKVIEAYNFLRSVAEGIPHGATLDDAVRSATALDAMLSSAEGGAWVSLA